MFNIIWCGNHTIKTSFPVKLCVISCSHLALVAALVPGLHPPDLQGPLAAPRGVQHREPAVAGDRSGGQVARWPGGQGAGGQVVRWPGGQVVRWPGGQVVSD